MIILIMMIIVIATLPGEAPAGGHLRLVPQVPRHVRQHNNNDNNSNTTTTNNANSSNNNDNDSNDNNNNNDNSSTSNNDDKRQHEVRPARVCRAGVRKGG